jgi:hypothetical protein
MQSAALVQLEAEQRRPVNHRVCAALLLEMLKAGVSSLRRPACVRRKRKKGCPATAPTTIAIMLRSLVLAVAALPTVLSLAFDLDPSGVKCIGDDVSKDVLIKGDFRVEVSCVWPVLVTAAEGVPKPFCPPSQAVLRD